MHCFSPGKFIFCNILFFLDNNKNLLIKTYYPGFGFDPLKVTGQSLKKLRSWRILLRFDLECSNVVWICIWAPSTFSQNFGPIGFQIWPCGHLGKSTKSYYSWTKIKQIDHCRWEYFGSFGQERNSSRHLKYYRNILTWPFIEKLLRSTFWW
jgi:hypothetical protein